MKKILLFLLAVVLAVPSFARASTLEDELVALQKKIKNTQKKIEEERSYRKVLEGQYKDAYKNVLEAKNEIDVINNRINDINKNIAQTKKDITSTKKQIAQKGVDVDKKRKNIGQLLTVIHKYRNTRFVDYVFSANDFSELLTRNRLMNQLLKGAIEAVNDLRDESAKLQKLRDDLKNKEKQLKELVAQAKLEKQRTIELQQYHENLMASIKNDQVQSKALEDSYERQQQQDNENVKVLIRRIAEEKKRPAIVWSGAFIWPLANGRVVGSQAEYGWRIHPIYGDRRFHHGLDVDAPLGTPVLASATGYVEWASWNGGYGNCIIIRHGNGMFTLYGHLSGYNCRVNQKVEQGKTIGYCGSTGQSTEPHVHFEVRLQNGEDVSPRKYLPPR